MQDAVVALIAIVASDRVVMLALIRALRVDPPRDRVGPQSPDGRGGGQLEET